MIKMLVVDDNLVNRRLIQEILKDKATCDSATKVREAIDAYQAALSQKSPYELILLDIMMPEQSGLEFLKYVRNEEVARGIQSGRGVPIIVFTAHKEHFVKAFDLGCDDYLMKPIDAKKLLEKIEKALKIKL